VNIWDYLKARLHLRPNELGHGNNATVDHVNQVVGTTIDTAGPAALGVLAGALKIQPNQLNGLPGVPAADIPIVADTINGLVASKLADPSPVTPPLAQP
jgi:hypothetical protein